MTKKLIYNNYDIDSNGKLVFSDLQSTYTYYWNDSKLMGYTLVNSSDGSLFNVKVMYGANDEPLGYTVTGDNDFEMGFVYTKNLQGDITGIYTLEGNSCLTFTYDAYGTPTYTVGDSFIGAWLSLSLNPFLYRGYMYDINTGLYYLQSRHYNPIYGRFLNADETGILQLTQGEVLGANLFAYCNNNPVMNIDPNGMFTISRNWLAFGLDVAFTLLAAYFAGILTASGQGLKYATKKYSVKRVAEKLLYDVIPKFKGLFSRFFTSIRTIIWRVTGALIKNSASSIVEKGVSLIIKQIKNAKVNKLYDIISCFFSAGSMVAALLDIIDGRFDGRVVY